jgi:transcriptional regulator with XRE-family HTH domain
LSSVVVTGRIGTRVASARRELGLNQKSFAERLGISIWALDRIENGSADAQNHLSRIADLTGRPQAWFSLDAATTAVASPTPNASGRLVSTLRWQPMVGRDLVLGSISLLVLIRFLTEVVGVIPRAANFVDVPIFLALGVAAWAYPRGSRHRPSYASLALPAFLFLALAAISTTVNLSRVAPGPVLVFLYGFLAPFGLYAAVYRLWPAGQVQILSRCLILLVVAQLAVVFLVDVPRFVRTHNPDVISGTFGTNQYQLVFFLLVCTGLLAGIFTFEKDRLAARIAPALFVLILAAVFLAQYRSLLLSAFLTVLLIGGLLGIRGRGIVAVTFVAFAFLATLLAVSSRYPGLGFGEVISTLTNKPGFYVSERLRPARNVANLYSDTPRFLITGTGPGTFSSRGWQTFATAGSKSASNVQGPYVRLLTGTNYYHTDVSDKYVTSPVQHAPVIQGSKALVSPYSDYLSLLAEVGVFGFLLITGVYLHVLIATGRLARRLGQDRIPGDPLPAVAMASTVSVFVLLQMALFNNWLEVTRLSFLAWALLAITHREYDARRAYHR